MAEPETFEDDLFADLYTEEDNAPKGESTDIKTEVSAPIEPKTEEPIENNETNGTMDVQTYEAEQEMDDDDEIDFNLGNGNNYDPSSNHETNGPGIKEDG